MKRFIALFALLASTLALSADVKISNLPLGTAAATATGDSLPYVDSTSNVTKRVRLWDLVNLPIIQTPAHGGLGFNASASTGLLRFTAGVGSVTTAALVNADISATAAITRSKLANGTNYRILANSSAGAMSENAAITASRAVVSDANGQLAAATPTTTEVNFLSGTPSGVLGGPGTSVDNELALFSGTGGRTIKRASSTGLVLETSGVVSALSASTAGNVAMADGTTWASTALPTTASLYQNGSVTATVAANAMTILLKDASGATASATSPVKISFRSSTAATGSYVTRSVTGALTTVISSGSTGGGASGVNAWIWVYAIDNAGTVELAWAGQPIVDEGTRVTTTAEGGAGAATSNTTLYSTTARSNVAARLIARLKVNEVTAGTWAAVPTEISNIPFNPVAPRSYIAYTGSGATTAGVGSVNTKVRRFLTNQATVGSDITYTGSSSNGDIFTINTDGLYSISYCDGLSSGGQNFGITVNDSSLATSPSSMTYAQGLRGYIQNSGVPGCVPWTGLLRAGDIVRAKTEGSGTFITTDAVTMTIVKVGF